MSENTGNSLSASAAIMSPIVANIYYPVLKKLGKQNIRKFLTERHSYVREIEERTTQGNGIVGRPVSLTFSVDPSALASLVELGQFGPAVQTVASITDNVLLNWLEKHSDLKKDGISAAQVQALVGRSIRINMSERDTEQRIIMLFADYKSLLRANGMDWLVAENPKMAVNHITDALKPNILKKRIKDDLTLSHTDLKKDFLRFMHHVIRRAEQYADYEEPEAYANQSVKISSGTVPARSGLGSGRGSITSPTNAANGQQKPISGGIKTKNSPDCLNPSCTLKYYLKECKNTSKERKEELYAELAERRKSSGEKRTTRRDTAASASQSPARNTVSDRPFYRTGGAKSVRTAGPPPAGRLSVSFQSVLHCIALPDSGADDNVIPRSLVERLEERGVFVPPRTLKSPVRVELAFQGPDLIVEVRQQAQLTVELQLAAGPLRLRNCNWIIDEYAMDEILLGRPLLQALGLNAAEHLSAVRDDYDNMDCSKIPSLTHAEKLTRLLLRDPSVAPGLHAVNSARDLPTVLPSSKAEPHVGGLPSCLLAIVQSNIMVPADGFSHVW
jgi:hypothetical protein